jgi:undecaprenyl-diphosphatase
LKIIDSIKSFDKDTLRFVQKNLRGENVSAVLSSVTRLGDLGVAWLIPAGIMLTDKKYRRRGTELLVCFGVCVALNNLVLKNFADRTRPFEAISNLDVLVKKPRDYSFPSGHAAGAFAAAYAIARGYGKRLGIPAYALASAISLTRVGVGVHYPSDVAIGAGAGTLISAATLKGFRALKRRSR